MVQLISRLMPKENQKDRPIVTENAKIKSALS